MRGRKKGKIVKQRCYLLGSQRISMNYYVKMIG